MIEIGVSLVGYAWHAWKLGPRRARPCGGTRKELAATSCTRRPACVAEDHGIVRTLTLTGRE